MRNFIVVGESRALVLQALLAIHSLGSSHCIVIAGTGAAVLRLSRLCSEYHAFNFYGADDESFVAHVNRFAKLLPNLTLVTSDCAGTRLVNRVRGSLRVRLAPLPDSAMLDCLDNKWHFYELCIGHGLCVPRTLYLASKAGQPFAAIVAAVGLPFVLKPLDQSVSVGICIIVDEAQYTALVLENAGYQFAPLIAQRFISGSDVCLNLLAINGEVKALSIHNRGHARVRFAANPRLERIAHVLARHLHYHGVMNIDARIEHETGQVYLLESNPRIWRSLAASVWAGVNFVGEGLQPAQPGHAVLRLIDGSADVYYHPAVRPGLWHHVLFGRGRQGRMARLMMLDPYFFLSSLRPVAITLWQVANWLLLKRRIARVY